MATSRRPTRATALLVLAITSLAVPLELVAQEHHVHTDRSGARALPLPSGDDVFHFVVYGDRTGGPAIGIEVLKQAVADTNLLDPDLVMTVGDLIEGYNTEAPWLQQMSEYRRVMAKLDMPWYPVAGNHDIYWRGPDQPLHQHELDYETHFGPLWYWFEHKNCGFVVLYTDEGNRQTGRRGWGDAEVNQFSPEQLHWLEQTLYQTHDLDQVFVFLHHPRWRDSYTGANWNDTVHPLLVRAGNVSAVFAGHIHSITYGGRRDGIEYFTLATVGGHLRDEVPALGLMHHLNVVTVREGRYEVATIPVGGVVDPRQFTDEFLADAELARALLPKVRSAPVGLGPDGSVSAELVLEVTNPCEAEIEATIALDVVGGGYWLLNPDHQHRKIAGGATETFKFRAMRPAQGFDGFVLPTAEIQVDYLNGGLRYSMPRRSVEIPVDLTTLPTGDGTARDRVLSLDGSGHVAVEPGMLADLPLGPLTLEAWVRADSLSGRTGLVTKTESSEFGLFVSDRIASFSVHAGGSYGRADDEEPTLTPGRWHHVAGVFDGSEVRTYVDGRLVGRTLHRGERRRNSLPLIVGGDVDGSGGGTSLFRGDLDEVRLSACARYLGASFEPQRRFTSDAETWLLLHFDQSIGPFQVDSSGHGHHGRVVGAVEFGPAGDESR